MLLALSSCADDPRQLEGSDDAELATPRSAPAVGDEKFVNGEWIVKLKPADKKSPLSLSAGTAFVLGGESLVPVIQLPSGAWLVRRSPAAIKPWAAAMGADAPSEAAQTMATADALKADSRVEYVQVNHILEASSLGEAPASGDPLAALQQWHYGQINLSGAWNFNMGDPSVRVAVIDTGTTPHPDLEYAPGQDFFAPLSPDSDPSDDIFHFIINGIIFPTQYHHGTHVMGIVGARANDIGTVGVCPECSIVPVRTNLTDLSVEFALDWAANEGGADVISMSFNDNPNDADGRTLCTGPTGGCSDGSSPSLCETIEAISDSVVLVASAGNHGSPDGATFPANCPGVIGVAASQPDTALAPYSNRGQDVDVTAPGGGLGAGGHYGDGIGCAPDPIDEDPYDGTEGVVSTWAIGEAAGDLEGEDLCYRYLSGTSMSAPHVAGVVGLMLTEQPTLTPDEVAATLSATASPAGVNCAVAGTCGAGMLDGGAAVAAVAVDGCGGCEPGSYCLESTCHPAPTLAFDGGEGASCGDFNVEHLPPDYLIKAVVTGRPNAQWTKLNKHDSCGGSVWWEAESGTFDDSGTHEFEIGNAAAVSCSDSTLGRWQSKLIVDGQESDEASFRFYASACEGVPNTCDAAESFCPYSGACNGLGCPGSDSCGGCAVGTYCFGGTCQPKPTISFDGGEGPWCGDMRVAHPNPDYLVKVTLEGRPHASWTAFNRHVSCAGSFWWAAESGTLDAWGRHEIVLSHDDPLGCDSEIAGSWLQRIEVDGETSNSAGFNYYESGCGTVDSCGAAGSFCPASGPFNGPLPE